MWYSSVIIQTIIGCRLCNIAIINPLMPTVNICLSS